MHPDVSTLFLNSYYFPLALTVYSGWLNYGFFMRCIPREAGDTPSNISRRQYNEGKDTGIKPYSPLLIALPYHWGEARLIAQFPR